MVHSAKAKAKALCEMPCENQDLFVRLYADLMKCSLSGEVVAVPAMVQASAVAASNITLYASGESANAANPCE